MGAPSGGSAAALGHRSRLGSSAAVQTRKGVSWVGLCTRASDLLRNVCVRPFHLIPPGMPRFRRMSIDHITVPDWESSSLVSEMRRHGHHRWTILPQGAVLPLVALLAVLGGGVIMPPRLMLGADKTESTRGVRINLHRVGGDRSWCKASRINGFLLSSNTVLCDAILVARSVVRTVVHDDILFLPRDQPSVWIRGTKGRAGVHALFRGPLWWGRPCSVVSCFVPPGRVQEASQGTLSHQGHRHTDPREKELPSSSGIRTRHEGARLEAEVAPCPAPSQEWVLSHGGRGDAEGSPFFVDVEAAVNSAA